MELENRKTVIEALRLSEQRYALAQRAANIGSWDWDIITGDLHWSDRIEPLFGFAPGKFGATYEAFLECVHPQDRRHVVDSVNASVERDDDYAIEHRIVWPDGTVRWVSETGDVIRDEQGKAIRMLGIVQDITERKETEAHQQLAGQILECLNRESVGTDLISDLLKLIKRATGFDAVAIRRREGNDFPYLEADGFSDDFVKSENYLCCHDETGELICDDAGRPVIKCICGNVLSGRADPALPFFTRAGSFWTNSTTELMENTPAEVLKVPLKNRCKEEGYESVALIPLRCGEEIVGLLQLNDSRRGRFTPEMIRLFEEIGASIGIGIARMRTERQLHLRNRIAEVFLTLPDDRMYGEVLEVLREALGSEYGFFGYIDEAGDLVCPSLTRDIWERCEMPDKTIVFARETWGDTIWARAITSAKSQLSNSPLKTPAGHVKIDRVLNVPVVYDEKSIGIIAVANKRSDYTLDDQKLLESIAGFVAPVLHARLQRVQDLAQIESLARFPSENPNPVLRISRDGTVLYANSAGSRLAESWGCESCEQAPENWRQCIARIFETGESEALEAFCEDRIFSLIMAPVKDAGYANVYGIDVTERRRAEESLREYRHHLEELVQVRTAELTQANEKLVQEIEQRKRLEKEILNISEREQRRIGRELHDSIGQQFTGIAFMMKVLEQKLANKLPDEATDAEEIKKLVNQAMDQTRGLARGLHSIDLDSGSLTAALQELVNATEKMFGVRCDLKCDELVPVIDAEIATHLYRITQEAITNAIKHGRAKNIQVEFVSGAGKSILTIENDGLDFPEKIEAKNSGMGLQIMDHRADIIGASLEIGKAPNGGTIVTCSFRNDQQ
ncbi:MAG: GAF domain-containing protein [Phycisphaerales bacterium]|nr:MAG: GAF domain-containing protein [Phycisphaerales bacterium]